MGKMMVRIGVAAMVLVAAGIGWLPGERTARASDVELPDGVTTGEDGQIVFRHVLDDEPIEFKYRTDQEITPAVEQFHKTAVNAYDGDEEKIAEGKKLWGKLCVACHLKDGTGRIGPSLIDDEWKYPRVAHNVGRFEIIYAGGAGAMQALGRRMDQDDILKVMSYLKVLRGETK